MTQHTRTPDRGHALVRNAARALVAALPNAEHRTLEDQTHIVKPQALAPVLIEFLAGGHRLRSAGR